MEELITVKNQQKRDRVIQSMAERTTAGTSCERFALEMKDD